ncbi:MAG: flavodoxin [Actinobacteria bacterium]|nr:MAG: flavodoxin [Actinomycetota bacterium]
MASPILVGYATRYGSTKEVAEAVAAALRDRGLTVDLRPLREVRTLDDYGAVVMGAALYMYRLHKDARRFLSRHRQALTKRPVAIFALGPVHDPSKEKEWRDSRAQLDKELANFPWLTPVAIEVFGGKFDPADLSFPMSWFAGKAPASDARDWDRIRAWAGDLVSKLQAA